MPSKQGAYNEVFGPKTLLHRAERQHKLKTKGLASFGVYHDDPNKVPANKCRSSHGYILLEGLSEGTVFEVNQIRCGNVAQLC